VLDRFSVSLNRAARRDDGSQAVSVHENLQAPKIDGCIFWDENLCIVFDAFPPISSACIDKIRHLYNVYIFIIFVMFILPLANTPLLKVEGIHATTLARGQVECDVSKLVTKFLPSSDEH
jgi:hypothetical protein